MATLSPTEVYELHVRVVEARDLKRVVMMGSMNVYAQLTVPRGTRKTPPAGGDDNPVFDAESNKFMLLVNAADTLVVALDSHSITGDALIGRVLLPLSGLADGAVCDKSYALHDAAGERAGEVHLRMQLMHGGEVPIAPPRAMPPPPAAKPPPRELPPPAYAPAHAPPPPAMPPPPPQPQQYAQPPPQQGYPAPQQQYAQPQQQQAAPQGYPAPQQQYSQPQQHAAPQGYPAAPPQQQYAQQPQPQQQYPQGYAQAPQGYPQAPQGYAAPAPMPYGGAPIYGAPAAPMYDVGPPHGYPAPAPMYGAPVYGATAPYGAPIYGAPQAMPLMQGVGGMPIVNAGGFAPQPAQYPPGYYPSPY